MNCADVLRSSKCSCEAKKAEVQVEREDFGHLGAACLPSGLLSLRGTLPTLTRKQAPCSGSR